MAIRDKHDRIRCGLNAPFGARCFLTRRPGGRLADHLRLNAPFGARCFLTRRPGGRLPDHLRLNAPFGARCFLTQLIIQREIANNIAVLMHLLALGAF